MKSNPAHCLCAALRAAAVVSGSVAAQTVGPAEAMTQSPMEPHRNADGSIKRGLRNTIQTGYWSGFAATAAAPYTSASGTFQVPKVTHSGATSDGTEYSSTWVGIGGYGDYTL